MTPSADLVYGEYHWDGGRERLAQCGKTGPAILLLGPLFEEANRTRHLLTQAMRRLATRGFHCFLPDLPGTLESTKPIEKVGWDDWSHAVSAVARTIDAPFHTLSIRGGALLDDVIAPRSRWRLTPAEGGALFREMIRIRLAADREDGRTSSASEIEAEALGQGLFVAGHALSHDLLAGLRSASLTTQNGTRVVRLQGDIQPADTYFAGQPLWRRSEPDHDIVILENIITNYLDWISACGAG